MDGGIDSVALRVEPRDRYTDEERDQVDGHGGVKATILNSGNNWLSWQFTVANVAWEANPRITRNPDRDAYKMMYPEFTTFCHNYGFQVPDTATVDLLMKMFADIDKDNDTYITLDDIRTWLVS